MKKENEWNGYQNLDHASKDYKNQSQHYHAMQDVEYDQAI